MGKTYKEVLTHSHRKAGPLSTRDTTRLRSPRKAGKLGTKNLGNHSKPFSITEFLFYNRIKNLNVQKAASNPKSLCFPKLKWKDGWASKGQVPAQESPRPGPLSKHLGAASVVMMLALLRASALPGANDKDKRTEAEAPAQPQAQERSSREGRAQDGSQRGAPALCANLSTSLPPCEPVFASARWESFYL